MDKQEEQITERQKPFKINMTYPTSEMLGKYILSTLETTEAWVFPIYPEDVDNEPVFPVCGTCNAQKDAYLLLPPEKIRDILQTGGTPFDFSMEIARAELNHLKELEIVYVSRQVKCDECDGTGEIKVWENEGEDYCMEGCAFCGSKGFYLVYIPLSDYLKGEGEW